MCRTYRKKKIHTLALRVLQIYSATKFAQSDHSNVLVIRLLAWSTYMHHITSAQTPSQVVTLRDHLINLIHTANCTYIVVDCTDCHYVTAVHQHLPT